MKRHAINVLKLRPHITKATCIRTGSKSPARSLTRVATLSNQLTAQQHELSKQRSQNVWRVSSGWVIEYWVTHKLLLPTTQLVLTCKHGWSFIYLNKNIIDKIIRSINITLAIGFDNISPYSGRRQYNLYILYHTWYLKLEPRNTSALFQWHHTLVISCQRLDSP
jgi:hypothetical protein